jgi:uncharacterized membrane protein YfcA
MIELAWWQWAIGMLCAYMVGVAKTGVPGLGIFVVPAMALMLGDAKQSAGFLLPVLCTADLFAVFYWRRHAAARKLFALTPWVAAGIAAGATALTLNERVLRPIVGVIVFVMLGIYLYRRWRNAADETPSHGPSYGVTAGFASTVANAAGPVMSLYLLSQKLPKAEFVATGAWFFFAINLTKVPIYAWHGMITRRSLVFDVFMVPAVLLGSVSGRWLVNRIPQKVFEACVVALTALSTLMLFR